MYFCYDIRFVCCTIFIICWIEFSRLRAIRICQLRTVMCGGSISHRRTSSPIWLADRQCDNNAAVVVTYWVLEYYTGHKCGSNAWQQMHELSVQSTICNIFSHFFFIFINYFKRNLTLRTYAHMHGIFAFVCLPIKWPASDLYLSKLAIFFSFALCVALRCSVISWWCSREFQLHSNWYLAFIAQSLATINHVACLKCIFNFMRELQIILKFITRPDRRRYESSLLV